MSECHYLVERARKRFCGNALLKNEKCVMDSGRCRMCIGYVRGE